MDTVQQPPSKTLKDWRASAGVGQEDLADRAGVSRATGSALERDAYPPQPESAGKLCAALSKLLKTKVNTWDVWPQHFKSPDQLKSD